MNKPDREYLQNRVDGIVKCTNGNIATILNRKKKGTSLTKSKKYQLVITGKATPKAEHDLVKVEASYKDNSFDLFLKCFTYPTTTSQAEKIAFNKTIDCRVDEMMQEVALEGKRLVDKAVLNLISSQDIPDALHALSEMANLARI